MYKQQAIEISNGRVIRTMIEEIEVVHLLYNNESGLMINC